MAWWLDDVIMERKRRKRQFIIENCEKITKEEEYKEQEYIMTVRCKKCRIAQSFLERKRPDRCRICGYKEGI